MNNRQARGRGRGRNNNRNNNRGGGIDRENRIDNRARGNAAQMLDKYKKMAQDAQVNGDRVNAEYYHQFADHYFRVNADMQARREEQRLAREEARGEQRDARPQRDDARDNKDNAEASENKKPVRSRAPRKAANGDASPSAEEANGLDASALPPAISSGGENAEVEDKPKAEKKPARKPRAAKPKPEAEEGDAA